MNKILNLTQHVATPEQVTAGVVEPVDKTEVQTLLTFDELPSRERIEAAAEAIAAIAATDLRVMWLRDTVEQPTIGRVMIGGAPFFMASLERALRSRGVVPLYAFSRRDSVDVPQADGSVKKTQIFKHAGFVEVP